MSYVPPDNNNRLDQRFHADEENTSREYQRNGRKIDRHRAEVVRVSPEEFEARSGGGTRNGRTRDGSRDNAKHDETLDSIASYETWTPVDLANYFAKNGLGDYHEVLIRHKISGKIAPLLTDDDLRDMKILIVGDRCRFRQQIESLKRKSRAVHRTKVMWEGQERLFFSCFDACIGTCCGVCPDDPSSYKLTHSHLKVRQVTPQRCGPITCCCCTTYAVNNIDLTYVDDIDMTTVPAPFTQQVLCCGEGKDIVDVNTTNEGKIYLTLKLGDGEHASQIIMNQIEESQQMERD